MVQKDTKPNNQIKYLADSDSDDNEMDPRLKTTLATQIALSHSKAQVNPTMERGPPQQKTKPKKSTSDNKKVETTSTSHKDK